MPLTRATELVVAELQNNKLWKKAKSRQQLACDVVELKIELLQ
jgi:hypothetical protein